ncbi:MAG: DNA translocase FtsK 4TM domain-containing protein [Elusimicrobiota bacterium]|jgi:S-DNA-T family DNA segregation ATPase FtsK/SpoIIIE
MALRTWRHFKAKLSSRKSKYKEAITPEFAGFCLAAVAILGVYCTVRPQHSGVLGAMTARSVSRGVGQAALLLWFFIGYRAFRLLFRREDRHPWRYVLVDAVLLAAVCFFLSAFGERFLDINPGGYLGKASHLFFSHLLGKGGSFLLSAAVLGALLLWRCGQKPGVVMTWIGQRLLHDWQEWRQAVGQAKEKPATTLRKALPKALPGSMEKPVVRARSEAPTVVTPPVFNAAAKPPLRKPVPAMASATTTASATLEAPAEPFKLPPVELLIAGDGFHVMAKEEELLASAQHLEKTLADFGVQGKVVEIHPGPIITRFDYTPAPGIKVQTVAGLANDIALAMKAMSVRIVAPIPGKSAVGIELPNAKRAVVRFREVVESPDFQNHPSKLALALGKDAEGHPIVADLANMPHLLIAGSTGSGKSVCIHGLIQSLMYRATPDEVKILLIDPKRLELPLYNGIPYLFDPNQNPDTVRVITDSKEAAKALEGVIKVMDHRFKKFASAMARDIGHYNEKVVAEGGTPEYYLVVIIDELADLMAVAAKEVETSIQRLAQMARAVGIHLVLATQRPSVDVITGVIKANLPARIAFRVASQTDSRVILDCSGAENLLGMGDMLFLPPGAPKPERIQCGLVTAKEVQVVSDYARSKGKPSYERLLSPIASNPDGSPADPGAREELDDLQQALMLVLERRRVSQDLLKAHFGSSARATDLLSLLEIKGFIAKPEGTNRWTIYFDRIDAYLGQLKSQSPANG